MSKIVIIDTGNGNLLSVLRAVEKYENDVVISSDKKEISLSKKLIFPGVGAFKNTVDYLKKKKIFDIIKSNSADKPFLGICLGMQLLFENSNEFGMCEGLNLIKGNIVALESKKLKIPNIGWYNLEFNKDFKSGSFHFLNRDEFYFIHSYYAFNVKKENLVAYYNFGETKVPAIVQNENIIGCQFHPEKSRKPGLKIIDQFIKGKF